MPTKLETLTTALTARDEEIEHYQINIDNFTRAIAVIDAEHVDDSSMREFRTRLADMLASSKTEQLKAKIIRRVINDQIEEMQTKEMQTNDKEQGQ